jgi:Uma2 family endonuclease
MPADVLLLIEVADTSLLLDRRVKMPLYARGGVREAWLCDLATGRVDVHRDVTAGRYASVRTFTSAQRLTVLAFPDISLSVAELLGPAAR